MMLPVPTARGDPREEFPAKRTFEKWPPILTMPFTARSARNLLRVL